ncbi:MAG: BlaI/MecI/CopY family transcriptional regulator [Actinomycetota bacterium]
MALGPLEREIMSCLWAAQGPLTVREVHAELSEHRQVAYTTVMTVLQRLARKGLAAQARGEKAHRYSPTATREQLAAEMMLQALGELNGETAREGALLHFASRMNDADSSVMRAALSRTRSHVRKPRRRGRENE